jgi:hypothetical protein
MHLKGIIYLDKNNNNNVRNTCRDDENVTQLLFKSKGNEII